MSVSRKAHTPLKKESGIPKFLDFSYFIINFQKIKKKLVINSVSWCPRTQDTLNSPALLGLKSLFLVFWCWITSSASFYISFLVDVSDQEHREENKIQQKFAAEKLHKKVPKHGGSRHWVQKPHFLVYWQF